MRCLKLRRLCAHCGLQLVLLTLTLLSVTSCCAQQEVQLEPNVKRELDQTISKSIERFGIPGMSVAIIKDKRVVYQSIHGLAHLEDQRPVDSDTVFSLYSVTKLFVAVGVFQLVENEKLSIDDPIGKHLTDLPQEWASIRIRNLLTHSSGLPAIAAYAELTEAEASAKVYRDPMLFEVGSRFRYTQTNYWVLRRIIEKLSGLTLQEFILQNQFVDAAPDTVLFIDDNTQRLDVRAKSYLPDNERILKPSTFDGPDFLIGAGGLNLRMAEFVEWSNRFDNQQIIQGKTIAQMWQPFEFAEEKFPMALGWGLYSLAGNTSYGFTGGGRVGFRKFPEQGLTVILLTNGYQFNFSADRIINRLAGLVDESLREEDYLAEEELFESFFNRTLPEATSVFYEIKKRYPKSNLEVTMNALGYEFLSRSRHETAIAIFRLNAREHPQSWNVWDSLGEACEINGDLENAKINFEKALELNPDSVSTQAAIARLNERL